MKPLNIKDVKSQDDAHAFRLHERENILDFLAELLKINDPNVIEDLRGLIDDAWQIFLPCDDVASPPQSSHRGAISPRPLEEALDGIINRRLAVLKAGFKDEHPDVLDDALTEVLGQFDALVVVLRDMRAILPRLKYDDHEWSFLEASQELVARHCDLLKPLDDAYRVFLQGNNLGLTPSVVEVGADKRRGAPETANEHRHRDVQEYREQVVRDLWAHFITPAPGQGSSTVLYARVPPRGADKLPTLESLCDLFKGQDSSDAQTPSLPALCSPQNILKGQVTQAMTALQTVASAILGHAALLQTRLHTACMLHTLETMASHIERAPKEPLYKVSRELLLSDADWDLMSHPQHIHWQALIRRGLLPHRMSLADSHEAFMETLSDKLTEAMCHPCQTFEDRQRHMLAGKAASIMGTTARRARHC